MDTAHNGEFRTDPVTRVHYSASETSAVLVGGGIFGALVSRKRSSKSSSSDRPPADPSNGLLASLPPDVLGRLSPVLEVVSLPIKEILHRTGNPIEHVYFPGGGFCSELTVLESGAMVEIATVGREGMVGIFARGFLWADTAGACI